MPFSVGICFAACVLSQVLMGRNWRCPACKGRMYRGIAGVVRYCSKSGSRLPRSPFFLCPQCGDLVTAFLTPTFCPKCGERLREGE